MNTQRRTAGDSRIRILQLISSMHIGGAERVIQHLTRHLDPGRFHVDVCCTQAEGVLGEELRAEGHQVTTLPRVGGPLGAYLAPYKLRQLVRTGEYDLVHTHSTGAFLDMASLRLLHSRPALVHTFHFGNFPHLKRRRYLHLSRLAQPLATSLAAVSETQRRAVIEHLRVREDRVTTIYNGVAENPVTCDPAVAAAVRRELAIPDGTVIVGCIASMIEQKGIPVLLETAKRLQRCSPPATFVVVGGGRLLEQMKSLCTGMNLDGTVRFMGWRADAPRFLAAFDVLVSSSLWEAFAMVLLEGMAARKPIVATRVGENDVAIEHGTSGLLVPPRDPDALADAIASLLADPALGRSMGAAAHRRYEELFTAQRMARSYGELYDRALATAGGDARGATSVA
jgi:glycosyltransferase involved in cell wall biosynthesis